MGSSLYSTNAMDFLPVWGVFLGTIIVIVGSIEAGYALGLRKSRLLKAGEQLNLGGGVAATLGLLAFMLAFTFGAGTSRLDTKKELILEESNAISTAFLRADLLPPPYRAEAKGLLINYVSHRLDAATKTVKTSNGGSVQEYGNQLFGFINEAKEYQSKLWGITVKVAKAEPSPITALFVNSVNNVLDLHQMRVTIALQQRMPMIFWAVLYGLAILAMGLAGYDAGASKGARALSSWVVAIAFSTVVVLVVGLDRPQTSVVNFAPLLEVQIEMQKAMKAP